MEEEILEKQEIIYVEEDIVDIDIIEGEPSTTISEEVKTIDVEAPQEVEVGVGEGFGSITSGNGEHSHPLLYGRDLRDQHPISAITGLEEKLESIESLKTLYSDKQGFANYYKWHKDAYDEYGYFVSLVPGTTTIKICEGADIFGVTVDAAGFVGGQDEVVPRDNKYALVATTGLVNVRCELDVEVGSYVVSNRSGVAESTDSGCGYKVVATPKINGEVYATISLGVQACITDLMGQKIQRLDDRLGEDEKNIVAAMQVANEAFQKAGESTNISDEALKDALEALKKTEEMEDIVADAITNVENISILSTQAKAISDSAVTSAERIREEAVKTANQALSDVSDAIADLDVVVEEMHKDIDDANAKSQLVTEGLTKLKEDMKPLSEWKDNEGNHSFAGFVAQSDENSAIIADLVQWQGMVEDGSIESIAGIEKRVSDSEAVLNVVSSYEKENGDGTTINGFAGLIAQVDENESNLSTLASYKYTDENGEIVSSGLAGLIQQVGANTSSIKMLAGFEDEEVDSLGEIAIQVGEHESKINSLTSWQTDTEQTITSIQQIADKNSASITYLTAESSLLSNNITEIRQQSNENEASIELMAASVDKYSVGEYSQSYGLTQEQANNILKDGMIYVPTKHSNTNKSHSETFSDTGEINEFTPGSYYIWNNNDWVEYTSSVAFFSEEPKPSRALKFWYIDSNDAPDGYEAYALYAWIDDKWQKVNVLAGNANNRITSMIRQTTNEIAAEVTNARGSYAGLNARLEADNQAQATMIASVVNPDGTVNTASIVNAVNDSGSSVAINADHIVLNGYTSNANGSFQIDENGYMVAKGGKIGGWYLNSDYLYSINTDESGNQIKTSSGMSGHSKNYTGAKVVNKDSLVNSGTKSNVRFFAGAIVEDNTNFNSCFDINDGNFLVLEDGSLYAFAAKIAGEITATSGKIGDCKISDGKLQVGNANIDSLSVEKISGGTNSNNITFSGNITVPKATVTGNITATSGTIGGWTAGAITDTINGLYNGSGPCKTGMANPISNVSPVFWAGYTGYGATPWESTGEWRDETSFYVTKEGVLNCRGAQIKGTTFGRDVEFRDGGATFELFEVKGEDGKSVLYCGSQMEICNTKAYTDSNKNYNPATRLRMESDVVELYVGTKSAREVGDMPVGVFTEKSGISIGDNECRVHGTAYANGSAVITSDRNLKHSIEPINEKYNVLFDNLKPVRFKYNDGLSDRYHTGLIAQDVKEAIDASGLSTQEVAAYVVNNWDEEGETCGIRYEEFIALLIQQVQDLKGRVSELEQRLKGENV